MIRSDIHSATNVEILYIGLMSKSKLSRIVSPQKILAGQRVSIPDIILKEWGLETGDFVIVSKEGKRMYIAPAKIEEVK